MKCIIIEDQPPAQRILKKYIEDVESLELVEVFSDAVKAMDFLKSHPVDLLFLDIHLPRITGIDFLKALVKPPAVILTTAYSDYALEGYELDVVDYLLKPFSFQRFLKAISKVPDAKLAAKADSEGDVSKDRQEVYIKSGHEYIRIPIAELAYIKSDGDYTDIFTSTDKKKYLSSDSLRHWLDHLDKRHFVQVHRSYIINSHKIKKIVGNQIYLDNEVVIPIGRAYKDDFLRDFVK